MSITRRLHPLDGKYDMIVTIAVEIPDRPGGIILDKLKFQDWLAFLSFAKERFKRCFQKVKRQKDGMKLPK